MITTQRLILRQWEDSDRQPFALLNADPRVMEFMPRLLTPQETNAFVEKIKAHFAKHGFGLFAASLKDDGAFIGFIGLSVPTFEAKFTPCVEIGWRLAANYWNRGLATEGAKAIVQHAFTALHLEGLVSFTVPGNLRSLRVMEKIGMRYDPSEDFDMPTLPEGHHLQRHVLYRLHGPSRLDRLRAAVPPGLPPLDAAAGSA